MKTLLLAASLALAATAAWADTVTGGGQFFNLNGVTLPGGGGNSNTTGTPWWNQGSDGTGSVGQFLNASQNFTSQQQQATLGSGQYLAQAGQASTATTFSFLQGASVINVAVLYANGGQNFGNSFGTRIGIYNVANPAQQVQIFGSGTLFNTANNDCVGTNLCNAGNSINGLYNAGNGSGGTAGAAPPSASNVNTFANWGIYAFTCSDSINGQNCVTYFSGVNGDDIVQAISGGVGVGPGLVHQHFALFQAGANATTFFVGFEDFRGTNVLEGGFGDYNDVILAITTGPSGGGGSVPEPATLSIFGLGLVGLGIARKLRKI